LILYVMRHGPAEDHAPTGKDFDRRLTESGRAVVARAAELLRASRSEPLRRILSSPLVRARETAEIVRRGAARPEVVVEVDERLSSSADIPSALAYQLARGAEDALLVGHNPNIDALARELGRGAAATLRGFRTAMIVAFEADEDSNPAGPRVDNPSPRLVSVVDPHA
jgi:phosphohistidine phosphatase